LSRYYCFLSSVLAVVIVTVGMEKMWLPHLQMTEEKQLNRTADNASMIAHAQTEAHLKSEPQMPEPQSLKPLLNRDGKTPKICFVARRTNNYGGATSDFVLKTRECYCKWFPPCSIIVDTQPYLKGEKVVDFQQSFNQPLNVTGTTQLKKNAGHVGKLLAVRRAWTDCDIIAFTDLDVANINFETDLRDYFRGDNPPHILLSQAPISGLNAGVYVLRTTQYSEDFVRQWWGYLNETDAHGDQGPLYDMALKRVTPKTTDIPPYKGECRQDKHKAHWGRQTGCFNLYMLKLGYKYPDWDGAWPEGTIRVTRNPKLQGFPYEFYGNRPKNKFAQVFYHPFNYSNVLDESARPQDLMVHYSSGGLSKTRTDEFQCENKGWKQESIFAHVANREIYSIEVQQIPYTHKELTEHGQKWANKNTSPRNKTWSVPKVNTLKMPRGLPGFIGVGCGHCGSTSMYTMLMQHPQMVPGIQKELLYFSNKSQGSAEEYAALFPTINDWQMTGEFSPYYLSDPKVPSFIKAVSPDSKILLMLRDPLSQCRSAHGYEAVREAMEKDGSCEFHKLLSSADPPERKKALYHPCDIQLHYMDAIERWQQHFDNRQLLFLDSEEFNKEPARVLQRVEAYLGLPHFDYFADSKSSKRDARMHVTASEKQIDEDLPLAHCFDVFREEIQKVLRKYKDDVFPWHIN